MSPAIGRSHSLGKEANHDKTESSPQDRSQQDRIAMLGRHLDGLEDEPGDDPDQAQIGQAVVDELTNGE